MIKGVHTMFYTSKPAEARAFLRDKLGFPHVDVGDGWLIFDLPEADMGFHPGDKPEHSISFYCDNIEQTVEELKAKGVEFTRPITDEGYGLATAFTIPGDVEVELYQPKYDKSSHAE